MKGEKNDYFNGTGGFVETSRDFIVYNIECVDEEDSNDVDTDFDEIKLKIYNVNIKTNVNGGLIILHYLFLSYSFKQSIKC